MTAMPAGSSRPFAGGGFFIVGVPPEAAKYFRRPGDGGQVDFLMVHHTIAEEKNLFSV